MITQIFQYLTSPSHCYTSSKISMHTLLLFLSFALMIWQIQSQSIVTLQTNLTKSNPLSQNLTIYNNSKLNLSFQFIQYPYYCSYNPDLYTYRADSQSDNNNTYIVNFTQLGTINQTGNVSLSISMKYYILNPFINSTLLNQTMNLTFPISNSTQTINSYLLQIQNNCPINSNRFSPNFDVLSITVENFSQKPFTFSYWILCQLQSTFQYGLLIIIIFSSIILPIIAVYSNAESISGRGLKINWIVVLALNSAIIIGGVIGITQYFLTGYIKILTSLILIFSWIAGLMGVWLCCNQLLFTFKRFKILKKQLYKYRQLTIRVMDIISMVVSLAICCAWFFSNQNYLLSDVIAVCMMIAAIKFFKFTSLKSALVCLIATLTVQSIFVTAAALYNSTYNTAILNFSSNPFELLAFTINPVYNQRCSWLPVTALIYPGALMSYMRRFDTSRNTKVYIIICIAMFLLGAFLWMLATVLSINQVPFGITVDSFTLLLCSYYAWKRKEMGMLWTGQWYDEEFQHKSELKEVGAALNNQSNMSQVSYKAQLFDQLKIDNTKRVSFLSSSDYGGSLVQHDGSQITEKITSDQGKVSNINQEFTERQSKDHEKQLKDLLENKERVTSQFPDDRL